MIEAGLRRVVTLSPGVALLCFGAVVAQRIGWVIGVNNLLVAIALGTLIANTLDVPNITKAGVDTHSYWLALGIVLMGASLTLDTVIEAGAVVLLLVFVVTGFTIIFVETLARNVFGLAEKLGSLLAAGTSICGVSAVVAVAGAVHAKEDQIAYAAATILLFDAITIVVYPLVGTFLNLPGKVFGVWAGVSMYSTGPVVAAGFSHSDVAGQWATLTKLTRNALVGIVVIGYASFYTRSDTKKSISIRALWDDFPIFIAGFVFLMLLASIGVFSASERSLIEDISQWLFLLAFVGIGTEIRLKEFRKTGFVPVLLILLSLVGSSTLALVLILVLIG